MVNARYTFSTYREFIRELRGEKVCVIALKELDLESE
jgi:hypothetical protein